MVLKWFNAGEAVEIGAELADQLALPSGSSPTTRLSERVAPSVRSNALTAVLRRADHRIRTQRLNFYQRVKIANSFKWRLLEKGIAKDAVDELTWKLVLHVLLKSVRQPPARDAAVASPGRSDSSNAYALLVRGNKHFEQRAYTEAIVCYRDVIGLTPRHADALNNIGAAFCKLGRYTEAEDHFRRAIRIQPDYPDAHANLGTLYRWKGLLTRAEFSLRRALELKPHHVHARSNLGLVLAFQGRVQDAKVQFEKVLRIAPRHADAILGMGHVAAMEGRFEKAGTLFTRVLEIQANMPAALAALAGTRLMTAADGAWLERAERVAASGIAPMEESELRFAIGKYYDDTGNFERAFRSYKLGNRLLKGLAATYQRGAHASYVDDLIRVYTRATIARIAYAGSESARPIFVVGMMRSGTSLVEQIIASHPAVKGAGELRYWSDALRNLENDMRRGLLSESVRKQLAAGYLQVLATHSTDAAHVVDKAPINCDYLGVIHSIFPNARIIYMRRNPIDTCLSCYFQQFSSAIDFSMDLSDLAHYYRQHRRLIAHWRAVLPSATLLDVPYADLVANQEAWTRKILDFVGLEWDHRCLDFHKTKRPVATSSYWQVRQRIYDTSVERWRNYKKFIGPLLKLRDLDS